MHVIELSKYKEGEGDKEKGEWIKFIKEGAKIKMNKDVNKALQEAMEELERLTASDEMQEMYYQRIKDLRDMISAISEGKKEGIEETQRQIVLNMHKKKMKIEDIIEITNLTKEEIEEIIKNS